MSSRPEVLGVVPARGGSKGVPGKNIRPLCGRPLIAYTLEEARNSRCLTRLIVSTDSQQIADIARSYHAEVPFLRPAALAGDDTPMLPVLQHAVAFLEKEDYHPDIVVLLQATSPLRKAEHIDQAVVRLIETGADCVVSLCAADHPPQWLYTLEGDRLKPVLAGGGKVQLRQSATEVYRLNGAVYTMKRDTVMVKGQILGGDTRGILMPAEASVDIDTELDFKLAELLLQQQGCRPDTK